MIYQTDSANASNQEIENSTLNSILLAIQALPEAQENQTLQNILTALGALATASAQTSQGVTLSSILGALAPLATAANQSTANASLASILSAMATAANQASIISGMATATNQASEITALNAISGKLSAPASAAISSINQSPTSQVVLASNANRKGLYLYNDSGAKLYVAYSATASSSAFTLLLSANTGQEIDSTKVYTGIISGVWASGTGGKLQITELT